MYTLKTTTGTARFYSWVWNTEVTKFKTMCPYFWKYILTIIFIIPILIGKLLTYLMPAKKQIFKGWDYISDSKVGKFTGKVVDKAFDKPRFWSVIGNIFKWLFFGIIGITALSVIIVLGYKFYTNPMEGLAVIGALLIFIVVIALTVYLFSERKLGSILAAPFRLFGRMISSLYHNWCPILKWN